MRYDPARHHRRSIRLKGYDYAREGAYFMTLCVQGRHCLFGEVACGKMTCNQAGENIRQAWLALGNRFSNLTLDEFIVMPNHFHGILVLTNPPDVGAPLVGAPDSVNTQTLGAGTRPAPTVGDILGAFKSLTTNTYIRGVDQHGWPPFPGRLWQRNYFERIVRNDAELHAARNYIRDNPAKWAQDKENPTNLP